MPGAGLQNGRFFIYKNTDQSRLGKVNKLDGKRQPLKTKNCNISRLFSDTKTVKSELKKNVSVESTGRSLFATFPNSAQTSNSKALKKRVQENRKHLQTIIGQGSVSKSSNSDRYTTTEQTKYHLRHLQEQLKTTSRDTPSLVNKLSLALSNFRAQVQVSKLDRSFDLLIPVKELLLLSPYEILVVNTGGETGRKRIILHSIKPIRETTLAGFRKLKLAINSKRYLELCNDVIWYIKWEFF